MRKLGIFVIFLFLVTFAVVLACAVSPDVVRPAVAGFLTKVSGGIYTVASDRWMALANYVSANGTYFLAYTLGILIFGGIFWLSMAKLWAKRPTWLHKPSMGSTSTVATGSTTLRSQTPVGATTRPTTQPSTPTPPVEPETTKEERVEK